MTSRQGLLPIVICVILLTVNKVANAALINLGNGLVNDTGLNITWLKDANLFNTLCIAEGNVNNPSHPILVYYNASAPIENAATVCGNSGQMQWVDAEKFIAALNANNHLGHSDWRQPVTSQPDGTCSRQGPAIAPHPPQGWGYRCTGSEIGHLFNVSLGNPNQLDNSCLGLEPHCLHNTGPFEHMQWFSYWSGTPYVHNPALVWHFEPGLGLQTTFPPLIMYPYVWPVRSGLSAPPPEPQSVPILGFWGLLLSVVGLIGLARRCIA